MLQISGGKASEKGEDSSTAIESCRPVLGLYIVSGLNGVGFDAKAYCQCGICKEIEALAYL